MIRERGGKFVVLTKDGSRVLGTHDTRLGAMAQLRAIEASKAQDAARMFDSPKGY